MKKLAVFDFDSTLMDGETIDLFAKAYEVEAEVSSITHKAMAGELDFFEALTQRVAMLKGLRYDKVEEIVSNFVYVQGAKEVITKLHERGYKVACFSGGFRVATSRAKDILGFDVDFANILHHKDGVLSGLVGGDMMFNTSKGDMLLRLQGLLGISRGDTLVVGDGANDLSMFAHADKRVAFCAKEVLKKEANIVIDEKDLTKILQFLE